MDAAAARAPKAAAAGLSSKAAAKPDGRSGREKLLALLNTVEAKLKDALLRERVMTLVTRQTDRVLVPRAAGYALVIDGQCLRAALHRSEGVGVGEGKGEGEGEGATHSSSTASAFAPRSIGPPSI